MIVDVHGKIFPALAVVARATASLRNPWWIIGSAALVLHGTNPGEVGDIDLLTSASDATTLLGRQGVVAAAGFADNRFRSAVVGR